ncbi:hypothetical protein [Flavobacterium covae]|uniref:hypothetical protein n=1 Tax=Flavobacterium covae TaxID=2906076 RepID=UPI000745D924|nr:hypothetical protein [Flavobacterium covae]AMA49001.1 hypothetical protein AWN65_05740 [Flavobacterium covae]MCJ1809920.1 hypothetical protein [Flavobacterium covae]
MIYFKAKELEAKPFVQWESVALSLKELQTLGLEGDPLIMSEDSIPDFMFGVCPLKIVDGQLVERTDVEMDVFEKEFNSPSLESIQKEASELVLKISTFKKLGENYSLLEIKLNDLRIKYQLVKNKEQVLPLNF